VQVKGLRNGRPFSATLHPVKLEDQLVPQIFVEPALGLTLATSTDPDHPSPTNPGFSSETADPPFKSGDRIVEIDGTPLKGDSFAELLSTLAARRGEVVLGVQRASKDGRPARTLTRIPFTPNHFRVLGLRMAIGKIAAIQTGSPAAGKLQVGDTITHVFENGAPRPVGAELDPMKLPDYFASRAGEEVQLKVKRETAEGNPTSLDVSLTPEPRAGWLERPSGDDCPLSVPAIGVAYHVTNHVVAVEPDSPAALAGIKEQDNIESVKLVPTADEKEKDRDAEKSATIRFRDEKKSRELRNWPRAFWLMQNFPLRTVVLEVRSQGGDPRTTEEITPKVDSEWFLPMLGLQMTPLTETRKADNIGEAVALGFRHTRDSIVDMWLTINGLIKGRISPKALGGPIRIAETAYYFSEKGIPDLILFLGILSVSLAVLNFLPIPVLDGGHFMFLCWEGIRGKPPSERVVVTATYLGLAVVLSLMAWVMYIDIASLIGGK
jgi:regulator of sigma E protease